MGSLTILRLLSAPTHVLLARVPISSTILILIRPSCNKGDKMQDKGQEHDPAADEADRDPTEHQVPEKEAHVFHNGGNNQSEEGSAAGDQGQGYGSDQ